MPNKKLIEGALPLLQINEQAAKEKKANSDGYPSNLHVWWARRPLATARAVIWASLVDDPSSHPETFPTEMDQDNERRRLFGILEKLLLWNDPKFDQYVLEAREEIRKCLGDNLPEFLDPFAGGGSIPLEAQRLGLKAHAHDLNPIPVMLNKALIEIPPKFMGQSAVNPQSKKSLFRKTTCRRGGA